MSIASELQNYADGLDDAWDAAEDMGATIPHDRNMVNLDDAIRTIPVSSPNDGVLTIQQNGTTLGTFTADQATNTTVNITASTTTTFCWRYNSGTSTHNLYKQTYPTYVVATDYDVATAFSNGVLFISDDSNPFSDNLTYVVTSWDDDCYRLGAVATEDDYTNTTIPYYIGMVWDSSTQTWTRDVNRLTYTAGTNVQISAQNVISATDTTYSAMTGATASTAGASGLVPAPAAGDNTKVLTGDGSWTTFTPELVEMSYGESNAWAKFIAAYNAKCIVYCRASSNSDPATGDKLRKAFMAYVNNETTPTEVEFQYVRSVKTKTDAQQGDQFYIYKLKNTNGGTWSVEVRSNFTKINVDSTMTKTFTQGVNASMTLGAKTMTGATSSADGAAGIVPKPVTGDNTKFLRGDGTWDSPSISVDSSYTISSLPTHSSGTTTYSLKKMGNLVLLNSGYIWYSGTFTAGNWEDLGSVPASLYPTEEVHTTATVTNGSTGQVATYGPLIIKTSGEIRFKPLATLSSGLYGYSFQATWLL